MNTRRPVLLLSFTLMVVMLGYGMVLPIMPFYIKAFGAGGREMGWLMATYSLMQLICAPLWGVLSDRIGRKPVLTLGVLGYAISLLMFGLATNFWMMFVARSLSGILSSATMPTAMAFIGDSASEKERSGGMGQLGAAMGVGVIGGPLLGGFLSEDSLSLPFFIGAGMAFVSFLLVIFVLPESHAPQPAGDSGFSLSRDVLRQTVLSPTRLLLLLIFVMSFGLTGFQGITGLYVVDKLGFDTTQVGAIWMVMGAMMIVAQGGLTGPLTKWIGEFPIILIGLAGGALGFIGLTLAANAVTIFLAVGLFTLAVALSGPVLNALISTLAGEQQGTIMGLNSAAASLGKVVGPLWAGYLYEVNIEYPYYSGAGALALALLVCLAGMQTMRRAGEAAPPEHPHATP